MMQDEMNELKIRIYLQNVCKNYQAMNYDRG